LRDVVAAAVLTLAVGTAALLGPQASRAGAQDAGIPKTEGWVLVASRCVICHGVEIAVQQRQGPLGWGEIIDRMVKYGMPLEPGERAVLVGYLVRHYGDPDGR
jgi:hypothetical protein